MRCGLCPDDRPSIYIGETSRNLYTRAKEHKDNFEKAKDDSFMFIHQQEEHRGEAGNFKAKVVKSFRDCLTRQISEGVYLRRSDEHVLNTKSEWHQPCLWRVQTEIHRG